MKNGLRVLPLLGLLVTFSASAQTNVPTVAVTGGTLAGTLEGGQGVFKNIPFAAPPVGALRWREPQPVKSWTGTREAKAFGPGCMQIPAENTSEDCLTLNVWAPDWATKAPKPVLVWIHGGGNTNGRAGTEGYSGADLAKRGVVVVTVQYRLGVFGYFAHPELAAESPHHASGNYGLLDQIAALKWVQENIRNFGGDPANVTIFGQSAGAEDVDLLMVSPLAKGLFHKAIAESGPLRKIYPDLAQQERECVRIAVGLKAPPSNQIAYLRGVPASDVLQVGGPGQPKTCRPTSVDNYVLTEQPLKAFAEGKQVAIPFIQGNTLREGFVKMPVADMVQTIRSHYGPMADRALALYGLDKGTMPPEDPAYGDAVVQYGADMAHRCRIVLTGIQHAQTRQPFYQFQFSRDLGKKNETTHSNEVAFVFGTSAMTPRGLTGAADRKLSAQMGDYWTNFAKSGDPNGAGLPRWAKFDATGLAYMDFAASGAAPKQGLRRAQCELFLEGEKARPTWEHPERQVPFNVF